MKERMITKQFLKRKERIYLQLMDEKRGTRFGLIPPSDMKDWVNATIYILQSCLLYSGSLQFVHPNVLSASKDGYELYSELRNRKKLEKIKQFIENNGNLSPSERLALSTLLNNPLYPLKSHPEGKTLVVINGFSERKILNRLESLLKLEDDEEFWEMVRDAFVVPGYGNYGEYRQYRQIPVKILNHGQRTGEGEIR